MRVTNATDVEQSVSTVYEDTISSVQSENDKVLYIGNSNALDFVK